MATYVAYHKCNYICFGNLKIPFPQYTLGDSILPRVNRVTDLGVVFTSDLKPSVQCSHIAAKAFGRLSLLMKGFLIRCIHLDPSLQNSCSSHTGVQLSCLESLAYF